MIGIYSVPQFFATSIAQILGGILGGVIVWLAYLPHWAETEDKPSKLGIFCTAPAIRNYPANFLCEFIATFFLMFIIWMIFSNKVGAIPPGVGPYIVGILIWALGMSLGGPTGYAMNRLEIWVLVLLMLSCRLPVKAIRTGLMPGFLFSARWLVPLLPTS